MFSKSRATSKHTRKAAKNFAVNDFMHRNQEWMKERKNKYKKAKEIAEMQEMDQCTFKPKTLSKEFLMKQQSLHLRNKISKSLSPHKIAISDLYDLSVMKKARMRIERQDNTDRGCSSIDDQVSPKMCPSNDTKSPQDIKGN